MIGFTEPGHIIVTDNGPMATLPVKVKESRTEVEIRHRLFEIVADRWPLATPSDLDLYQARCRTGSLKIIEDDLHGHQVGVVLKKTARTP